MMKRSSARRIRPWRRLAEAAQAAVVLGLPFLRIGGQSALRFDVPTLRLHAFGATLHVDELFVVLAASLLVCFAFLLVTLLYGRLWCGWACPQTALLDLTSRLRGLAAKGGWRVVAAHAVFALVSALVSANLIWYFVPPQEFFRGLTAFSLSPVVGGTWLAVGAVVYFDLAAWRHGFCATTCPYAKLQGALLDRHSMVIAYDARRDEDCIDCGACVRVCPVGIDIRDGLQAACTSCGECIDACAPIMAKLRRRPRLAPQGAPDAEGGFAASMGLVGYFFGEPGTRARPLRAGVLALAALTAASLALTVAVAADRSPLEVTVTASGDFRPRSTPGGEIWNGLTVVLENRGREPLDVKLTVRAQVGEVLLRPEHVALGPGEHRRVRVLAVARGLGAVPRAVPAELSATARGAAATRAVSLTVPEARP
jgi:cytochrome c oxidase accessory protein FixG